MKQSVLIFCLSLSFANASFAENIRSVEGIGKFLGYFEENDEWSLHHTKNNAKREADDSALEKCSNIDGKPLVELASYTSSCQPQPRTNPDRPAPAGWHWFECTVKATLPCQLP